MCVTSPQCRLLSQPHVLFFLSGHNTPFSYQQNAMFPLNHVLLPEQPRVQSWTKHKQIIYIHSCSCLNCFCIIIIICPCQACSTAFCSNDRWVSPQWWNHHKRNSIVYNYIPQIEKFHWYSIATKIIYIYILYIFFHYTIRGYEHALGLNTTKN